MIEYVKKLFRKYIGDSAYKKNVLTMIIGRVLGQVIPILLTPLLTRIYSPEEFGVFAVYITIVTILAMISNGRYCLAVILPKKEQDAKHLVMISFLVSLISILLFIILISLMGPMFFRLINSEVLQKYIWIIILNILFIALHETLFYYALRLKKYRILASDIIFYTSVVVIVRLWLGYSGYTGIGLFTSYMVGYTLSFVYLFLRLSILKGFRMSDITFNYYKSLFLKYSRFPKYSLLADTLNMTSLMSPNLFLNKLFGSATAGYFSMSNKVLGSPIWLVTTSVGDVFKQEVSEQLRKRGNCFEVFIKTARTLFLLGFIPFLLLFIVAPYLFPIILGANWEPVGYYVRIFSLMYFAKFVVNPVSQIVYILDKQNYGVLFQSLKIISIIIAFSFGYWFNNINLGLILWSGLTTVSYIIIFLMSQKLTKDAKTILEK